MAEHIYKRHNRNLLLYHVVCPIKYRRKVLTEDSEKTLKDICEEISQRYEIRFVEIGTDEDHVHFLLQTVPNMNPSAMVKIIKSITAKEIFKRHTEIRKLLWGGKFWTSGFYINTVGQYGDETMIRNYVKNQGREYQQIQRGQPTLFDNL
ncbi:MAG: IS200/IS605 family transposase [Candidatus Moraniibacteriota bacterium]